MLTIEGGAKVLVTGATGYVAGWLIKDLLDKGCTVLGSVRDLSDADKHAPLRSLAENSPGTLELFEADLLADGSFDAPMAGCQLVFHTASPFRLRVRDAQKDLVDPAVQGTRNVLAAASRNDSVRRVVITSSVAAIYNDNMDIAAAPNGRLDETVWNTRSSLVINPYSYSKTLAEKEAWAMADGQDRWDLVTINPSLVVGPGLHPRPTSESFSIIKQMGDGTMRAGAPRWGLGAVDVRDVAAAHLAAGFLPDAEGRHIVNGHCTDFAEIASLLRERFGRDYPLPSRVMPKWFALAVAPFTPSINAKVIKANVNRPFRADNSKSIDALGMSYRPLKTSLEEMFEFMVAHGWFAS